MAIPKHERRCTIEGCDTPEGDIRSCEACDGHRCFQHSNYCHDVGAYFCNAEELCDYRNPK